VVGGNRWLRHVVAPIAAGAAETRERGGRGIAVRVAMRCVARIVRVYVALITVAGCGLAPSNDGSGAGGKADDPGGDHPPGCSVACDLDETILVAGSEESGRLAIERLGSEPGHIDLDVETGGFFVDGTSRDGLFYALFSDGVLATIDGNQGTVVSEVTIEGGAPFALEARSPAELYVSFAASAVIARIDPASGEVLADIDIAPDGVADVAARHMLLLGDQLYVAASLGTRLAPRGTHLAVVDVVSGAVVRRADLVWQDPDSGARRPALNPDLPLVLDEPRHRLFVGAKGKRPSDTGMTLKVDLESLAVDSDPSDLSGTFNGHQVISQPFERVVALEHTSTPVASTHVALRSIEPDGRVVPHDSPTVLDLFEETDGLSINGDGTVAMLANSCPAGFCISGIGVNFIDVENAAVLPKLTRDRIGFSPVDSVFLRD